MDGVRFQGPYGAVAGAQEEASRHRETILGEDSTAGIWSSVPSAMDDSREGRQQVLLGVRIFGRLQRKKSMTAPRVEVWYPKGNVFLGRNYSQHYVEQCIIFLKILFLEI